jgi:hypothetical protein
MPKQTMRIEIKNEDALGGRQDWKGRTPRWRLNLTHAELSILQVWGEYYRVHVLSDKFDPIEEALMAKILRTIEKIQKPLLKKTPDFGFLDE